SAAGVPATSPVETWKLSIRKPSVSAVSFVAVVDRLRCARQRERVYIPAHWAWGRSHGHRVRVKIPAQTRAVWVERCHPRLAIRRVRRNGHWRTERFVILPHVVRVTNERVP